MDIKDYVSTFDQKYKKFAKLNMNLPSEILAFISLFHPLNQDSALSMKLLYMISWMKNS